MEQPKLDLTPAIKILGEEIVKKIVMVLIQKDKKVTGKLVSSINSRTLTIVNDIAYQLQILDDSGYFETVDQGRRPGKMPPVNKIEKWCKLRGINLKYAWPIAINIGKFGLPANNIFDEAIKDFDLKPFEKSVEEKVFAQITEQIMAVQKDKAA